MEIVKISENQVKFVLSKGDLQERGIKLSELAYGTEKTQELFRDMMTQAMLKYDFHTENIPLMIEAIPISSESIIILVTKVTNPDDIEERFNYFNTGRDKITEQRTIRKPEIKKINVHSDYVLIYSFDNLDGITQVSKRLFSCFFGISSVYKLDSRYYLVLENYDNKSKKLNQKIESILTEFGVKHISTSMSKFYLIEHAESIIKANAIDILRKYLG